MPALHCQRCCDPVVRFNPVVGRAHITRKYSDDRTEHANRPRHSSWSVPGKVYSTTVWHMLNEKSRRAIPQIRRVHVITRNKQQSRWIDVFIMHRVGVIVLMCECECVCVLRKGLFVSKSSAAGFVDATPIWRVLNHTFTWTFVYIGIGFCRRCVYVFDGWFERNVRQLRVHARRRCGH